MIDVLANGLKSCQKDSSKIKFQPLAQTVCMFFEIPTKFGYMDLHFVRF